MKEHPILFNAAMVQAIQAGRKYQTRRVIKPQPENMDLFGVRDCNLDYRNQPIQGDILSRLKSPYGVPGDRLWVRETWARWENSEGVWGYDYRADRPSENGRTWKPSIHMPRKVSRILLEVIDVRFQRVQDISDDDAKAEGVVFHHLYNEWGGVEPHPSSTPSLPQWRWYGSPRDAFQYLWDSINKDRGFGWNANPWVFAVEFRVVK